VTRTRWSITKAHARSVWEVTWRRLRYGGEYSKGWYRHRLRTWWSVMTSAEWQGH
jgi:hypothetical protein